MQSEVEYYRKQADFYQSQVVLLQAQLDQLKRMIFGAKSERFIAEQIPGQMTLDLGAEAAVESIA